MKKIYLLHTGGTIAMRKDEQTGQVQQNKENPFTALEKQLHSIATITSEQYANVPSTHIGPRFVLQLSQHIQQQIKEKGYEGVVITHGTDTMEETAYLLDLLQSGVVPIVLTGAMRSSNELSSDGARNLFNAVRVAASEKAVGAGTLIVMNETIHSARAAMKTHTSDVASFKSINSGPIGTVTHNNVIFFYTEPKKTTFNVSTIDKKVILLKVYSGMEIDVVEAIEGTNIDGLVIEAFGQGNLPPTIMPAIKRLLSKKIPVVLTSRSPNGIITPTYDYVGGGKQLKSLGIIFAQGLSGQKARLKLLLALQSGKNEKELSSLFKI